MDTNNDTRWSIFFWIFVTTCAFVFNTIIIIINIISTIVIVSLLLILVVVLVTIVALILSILAEVNVFVMVYMFWKYGIWKPLNHAFSNVHSLKNCAVASCHSN